LELSQRLYRRLLAAYPRRHRQEYGGAMAQLFRDQCRDAWTEGRILGLLALWLRTLPDLVKTSFLERFSNLNPGKFMSDKLTSLLRPRHSPMFTFFAVFTGVFLLVFIASLVITFILPETYASTCRIKVEPEGTSIGSTNIPSPNIMPYDAYATQTTFEIIQSQMVLSNVVDKLDLNVKWGRRYDNGKTLKTAETMELLKRRLDLRLVRNTALIAITADSENKNEAAQLANAVATAYQDYRMNLRKELSNQGLSILAKQLNESEQKVTQSQTELEALRQKYNVVDNPAGEHQAEVLENYQS
jgi:capsular polysaccharide biosynthesis protein